ncbi:MAG: TonB-dependent receptor [Steroidobacteraceae bacterium]
MNSTWSRQGMLGCLGLGFCFTACSTAMGAGVPGRSLDEVVVTASSINMLVGEASAASEGTVSAAQIENRPVLRTGEVLEVVPGLIVTQHSGDGKANQFFLRGFNLDHGTDFNARVDGLPVNMPTHAHGQGYNDINFMIPELIDRIEYKKGTYYADEGNFSAAGSVDISYKRALSDTLLVATGGEHQYRRGLLATSLEVGGGDLLVGLDSTYANGPWQLDEDLRKLNGLVKFTYGDSTSGFAVTGMAYDGKWQSTDQIPQRAVDSGELDRFGYINASDGGKTHRYSLSASGWSPLGAGQLKTLVYGIDYQLDLFSNFSYFIDQDLGDQFEQYDKRHVFGGDLSYTQPLALFGKPGDLSTGIEIRYDDIAPVGLYLTQQRQRYETIRQDDVQQTSYSAYVSQATHWTDWLRSTVGLRADAFRFKVDSSVALNSGTVNDSIASPKLTLAFGPWQQTEFFLDWGRGFHSNDARGTTIKVDPTDGVTPVEAVTPLVRAEGQEVGVRSAIVPQLQLAASLWTLKLDSELLFVGDGGTTEPSRASRRTGTELSAYYTPVDDLIIDADFSWSHARFTEDDPAGDRIPNAVEQVGSLGITYNRATGVFGGVRLRYLGPAPLIEDNSVRSEATTLVNLSLGYHLTPKLTTSVALLNVFDEQANDITYYYESQLRGEAEPVSDIHFHPVEPRQMRVSLTARF